MNKSNYNSKALLNALHGKTSSYGALASAPAIYLALVTTLPTRASTGATIAEANYTGYARKATVAADWNAATGTYEAMTTNANQLDFPKCTAGTNTIVGWAELDSATLGAGNVINFGQLYAAQNITSIARTSGTATVTLNGHGYANGDQILITGAQQPEYNGFFTISNVTTNTFDYTVTGTPTTPATGTLVARKATTLAVSVNITPSFAAGAIAVIDD